MEDGVCGDHGVPAVQRQERRKEQDSVTTHHLAMVEQYVLGLQVTSLYVLQVIYIQVKGKSSKIKFIIFAEFSSKGNPPPPNPLRGQYLIFFRHLKKKMA